MGIVIPKLRQSAKGQPCMFEIPGICNYDRDTVVLCHIHDSAKGMATKANDWSAAFGCSACHEAIDQHWLPRADTLFYCLRAMQRTWHAWIDAGQITIAGDNEKSRKPSSKTVQRSSLYREPTLKEEI